MRAILSTLFAATAAILLAVMPRAYADDHGKDKRYVLVTGTSTGIGRNLVETLSSKGYHVYAGVLYDEEKAELDALDNVTAIQFDVTSQDEVDAALAFVVEQGTGLYALVNNAGIGGGGPVADTDIEAQTEIYAVNVEGVYRVTKAFAPLIVEAKGRILTTGSIAGTIAWAGGSAYSGSKHWIEAYTDALAAEMAPAGVFVGVIEPGNYQSHIRRSSVQRMFARIEAQGGEITPEMREMYQATVERELSYKQPDEVTAAYLHALFDDEPLRRYVVVPNAGEQQATISTKINELVQLNQWGPYSYSRDELVEMLDAALTGDGNKAGD